MQLQIPHLHNITEDMPRQLPDTGVQFTPGAWLFLFGLPTTLLLSKGWRRSKIQQWRRH